MVPKILHYIWLGKEKPPTVLECINSFHKYMSDYEITEWNESNIDTSKFSPALLNLYEDSYKNKQYAFCSDVARLYILLQYGGVYVDTDVEFIRHLPDEILNTNFIGRLKPHKTACNGCMWGCNKNNTLVSSLIRWYDETLQRFSDLHGKKWIFNTIMTQFFELMGDSLDDKEITDFFDYKIYPTEYFCPIDYITGIETVTQNTVSIHHFNLSWRNRSVC